MNIQTQGSAIASPIFLNNIQTACPAVSEDSYSSCVEAFKLSEEDSVNNEMANGVKILKAIANIFGGVEYFCNLPELTFNDEKHMGGTGYLDRFQASDLCAPVMRGIDSAKRLFVTFGIQQKVAAPETHAPKNAFGREVAYTIFQRYSDSPTPFMSAGHPSMHMSPLRTAKQQYVDKNGAPQGDLPKLKDLVQNGYIEDTRGSIRNTEGQHVELHLMNNFAAKTDSLKINSVKTENKDEL